MTNSKFIQTINKLFKEINVTYKILQYKKKQIKTNSIVVIFILRIWNNLLMNKINS